MNLDDLGDVLQIELPNEEDLDSVGGLVLKVLGHVPVPGETFVYDGLSLKVEKLRRYRISKVIIEILGEEPVEEGKE